MIQVPQCLLDNMWGKGEACKIVCTQPQRISATSGMHSLLWPPKCLVPLVVI